MGNLDRQQQLIVRELIKNPRISDNQISKNTKVPVMTVNRKRKIMEEKGILSYYTSLNTSESGTGTFAAKQLYIIKFKIGITGDYFFEKIRQEKKMRKFNAEYIVESHLGEKDGHFALMVMMAAPNEKLLVENFNGKIVPMLEENFGTDSIIEIMTSRINNVLRMHHNYLPAINMKNGIISKEWLDDWIFVDELTTLEKNSTLKSFQNGK